MCHYICCVASDFMVKRSKRYVGARKLFFCMKFMSVSILSNGIKGQAINFTISKDRREKNEMKELVTKTTTTICFSDRVSFNRIINTLFMYNNVLSILPKRFGVDDLFFIYKRANSLVYHNDCSFLSSEIPMNCVVPPNCFRWEIFERINFCSEYQLNARL